MGWDSCLRAQAKLSKAAVSVAAARPLPLCPRSSNGTGLEPSPGTSLYPPFLFLIRAIGTNMAVEAHRRSQELGQSWVNPTQLAQTIGSGAARMLENFLECLGSLAAHSSLWNRWPDRYC